MKRIASAALSASFCFVLSCAMTALAPAQTHRVTQSTQIVGVYASMLRSINPGIHDRQSRELAHDLLNSAERWKLDANLLAAVVTVESAWRTNAISRAGAIGLGQLTPDTAADLGVNPHNPRQNLSGAARYLSNLIASFGARPHRYELAFAAYNAGPNAVKQFGGIPPYAETQQYVARVLRTWRALRLNIKALHRRSSSEVPESH